MDTINDNYDAVDVGTPVEAEHVLTQERVNEIVKREKAATAAKARKEALLEIEAQNKSNVSPEINHDEMYENFKERMMSELQAQQQQAEQEARTREAQEVVGSFFNGMGKGSEFAPDFNTVTAKIDVTQLPNLVQLIGKRDDVAPLMYEFANHPDKAMKLNQLALISPEFAMSEIDSLSNSIMQNRQALENTQKVNPPLSTVKPSISAGAGGDEPSMSDLKRKYRF
jgi:hypothetical protein